MLTKLRLHNFRTYLNAEIEFEQRHLVIGRNNSGKTNLVSAIHFLGAAATSDLNVATTWVPGGIPEIRNWSLDKDTIEIECTCELDYQGELCEFTYELVIGPVPSPETSSLGTLELRVIRERLTLCSKSFQNAVLLDNDGHEAKMLHEEQQAQGVDSPYTPKTLAPPNATMLSKLYELDTNRRAILFRRFLANWMYNTLSPHSMRIGWQGKTTDGFALSQLGDNLANVLFQLKNREEMRYRRIIEHVKTLEPSLEAINFYPTPDQGIVPSVALRGRPHASWAGLSDGTIRLLALAYIIELSGLYPNEQWPVPALWIIEEPENGIAPTLLGKVFDLFEERAPNAQFILTSHSPYVIDRFDGSRECVTLLRRKEERTEIVSPPPVAPEDQGPDRLTLAEQYAAELLD